MGMDIAFIVMLFLTSLTGLAAAAAARNRGDGPLLAIHLGVVFALFITHALRKVRARHLPLRRTGALRARAQMMAGGTVE